MYTATYPLLFANNPLTANHPMQRGQVVQGKRQSVIIKGGLQSHQHQGYWGLEKLRDVLRRFSRFGLPLHFTENTLISGSLMPKYIEDLNDWQEKVWPGTPEGEERQRREVEEIYTALFATPLVEAVTVWDAVDAKWLNAPSGLPAGGQHAKARL